MERDGERGGRGDEWESHQARPPAHSVGDPDLGYEHVTSEVHHPPVALVRCGPEAAALSEEAVHRLTGGVVSVHTAGCGWRETQDTRHCLSTVNG